MKITRKELKQLIQESMYSPSTIIDDALNDPVVDDKIKKLLQHPKAKRMGIKMLQNLYPRYKSYGKFIDLIRTSSPDYANQFDEASDSEEIMINQVAGIAQQAGVLLGEQDIDVYQDDFMGLFDDRIITFVEIYRSNNDLVRIKQALDRSGQFQSQMVTPEELRVFYSDIPGYVHLFTD